MDQKNPKSKIDLRNDYSGLANEIYGGYIMNNKGVGAIFCLISAILASARYISAALFMSNAASWDSSLFQAGLSYVGSPLKTASIIALIIGICFLGYGVVQDFKKQEK